MYIVFIVAARWQFEGILCIINLQYTQTPYPNILIAPVLMRETTSSITTCSFRAAVTGRNSCYQNYDSIYVSQLCQPGVQVLLVLWEAASEGQNATERDQ